jgi:hypothetical protein
MLNVSLRVYGSGKPPLAVLLLGAACVTWPFYLLPQGFPQIYAVFALGAFAALCLYRRVRLIVLQQAEIQLLWIFTAYTVVINTSFALTEQDIEPLSYSVFYLVCMCGATAVHALLKTEPRTARAIYYGVVASLLLQLPLLFILGGLTPGRQTLLFNNPNQLGFYGLLALTYVCFLHRKLVEPTWLFFAAVVTACLVILLSLSKAAIVSSIALLLMHFLLTPAAGRLGRRWRPLLLVLIPCGMVAIVQLYGTELDFLDRALTRISAIGSSSDDNLAGRGYGRIVEFPYFMFFGAGEGAFERWDPSHEIHSMLGTLLFCYGAPGLAIFGCLFAMLIRRAPRDFAIYVMPTLLYSLTHNPLRQMMMWALFVLIAHVATVPRARATESVAADATDARQT